MNRADFIYGTESSHISKELSHFVMLCSRGGKKVNLFLFSSFFVNDAADSRDKSLQRNERALINLNKIKTAMTAMMTSEKKKKGRKRTKVFKH